MWLFAIEKTVIKNPRLQEQYKISEENNQRARVLTSAVKGSPKRSSSGNGNEELVEAIKKLIYYYIHQRRQHKLNCLPPATYRSLMEAA